MDSSLIISLYVFTPPLLACAGAICIGTSFPKLAQPHWLRFGIGVFLLLTFIGYVMFESTKDDFFNLFLLIEILIISLVVVFVAIYLVLVLPRWWKLAPIALSVIYPFALYFGFQWGDVQTPAALTLKNRDEIVTALARYYSDHHYYPPSLSELAPDYLDQVPPKLISINTPWQYKSDGTHFVFGYLEYPDTLWFSSICSYDSTQPNWYCASGNFEPFGAIPTP